MTINAIVDTLRPLFQVALGYPWYLALIAVMTLDIITGILAAFYTKTLSSKVGQKGLAKKIGVLCLVALSAIIDPLLDAGGWISRWTVIGFVLVEALSILENTGRMGIITPVVLRDALEEMRGKAVNVRAEHVDINMPDGAIAGGKRYTDPPSPENIKT